MQDYNDGSEDTMLNITRRKENQKSKIADVDQKKSTCVAVIVLKGSPKIMRDKWEVPKFNSVSIKA